MKKIINTIVLLVTILFIPFIVNAKEKITKQALSDAYRDLIACQREGNYEKITESTSDGNGGTINYSYNRCNANMDYSGINMEELISDNKIKMMANETLSDTIEYNYEILENGDILFSKSFNINNTTTFEQFNQMGGEILGIITNYVVAAKANGVPLEDGTYYMSEVIIDSMLSSLFTGSSANSSYIIVDDDADTSSYDSSATIIKKSEFPAHAIEYVKYFYQTGQNYNDKDSNDTYEYTVTIDDSNSSNVVLTTKMLVKTSNNFDNLVGALSNKVPEETSKNSLDPVEEEEVKDTSTTSNPNTGDLLKITSIIVLIVLAITILFTNKSVFKKI